MPVKPADPSSSTDTPTNNTHEVIVRQHKLSDTEPITLHLPEETIPLDVHNIDGVYYLRTLEPLHLEGVPNHDFVVVPAALNSAIKLLDTQTIMPLIVRSGGIHFFAVS